jgi:hypothetical protein
MTDDDIIQDALNVRANAPDFSARKFALNYRLSRESREFEYLGTDRNGLWGLANAPSIGTTKRKASEIGQDYRFLLDYRTPVESIEEGLIEHVLTFYEYLYGILPLDPNIGSIMPNQGFADQRAARVTFTRRRRWKLWSRSCVSRPRIEADHAARTVLRQNPCRARR